MAKVTVNVNTTWYFARKLFAMLLLLVCTMTPARAVTEDLFEQFEVMTGTSKHQTVLTGFFLGGATAEIAVLRIDDNDDRRIQLYGFDGAVWLPVLDATMDSDVLFADVANIGGRDRLISYEQGRVNWFDPESASERPLVEVAMHYNAADNLEGSATQPGGDIPHVDITRDLNHDGRDDLILPDFDGFWISTQLSDGSFTGAVKLGPPEPFLDARWEARSYKDFGLSAGTIPVYLSRVHEMDYNRDGRSDLVFWNEDHFDVYAQNERGLFDPVATTFTADVPIDSDGAYSRISDFGDEGLLSLMFGFNENTRRTVLHSLRDLDGDQVADLVTLTLAGRAAFKQRSLYEAHFGTTTPDGTLFARDVSTAIHPRGKAGLGQPSGYSSQWFEDFDGDGQVDIMFRDVRIGLGGMARALVGNSVAIDLELYRMEDGVYPDKPTFKRNIRRFAPFAGIGNVFLPTVRIGDVNGDERVDLLVGQSPEKLHIFLGVPGPKLLTRKPQNVAVALPSDERHTRLVDLNKDGKEDVLVHQTPTSHEPTNPHRITVLIAR